jgi:excinuclease ABC subunit C
VLKGKEYKKLPETPGVYIMKDADGRVLYVGKAGNLRRRVSSYFERPHDVRIETLVSKIARIDHEKTDTALEALILEAELIRKLTPPFNVKEKDDKSFLYVGITREQFPRVMLVRRSDAEFSSHTGVQYGPFTSASSARVALKILRKIFPWSTHDPDRIGTFNRPCFDYEIGLCPGTCIGAITREDYLKNIDRLKLFFEGKKKQVIRAIEKDMAAAASALDFERAAKLRHQLFALKHIRDTALISDASPIADVTADEKNIKTDAAVAPYRIEGYDISNISGTSAVGSMVVFEDGAPNKNEYRKFKIRTIFKPNDVGMLTEVLERRFMHAGQTGGGGEKLWALPKLILIDGGIAQANAAKKVLMRAGLRIPILGIAKGAERKRNDILGAIPRGSGVTKEILIRVRNEAHRFAIGYHKKLRARATLS